MTYEELIKELEYMIAGIKYSRTLSDRIWDSNISSQLFELSEKAGPE